MTDIYSALEAVRDQVATYVEGLELNNEVIDVEVGVDWPSRDVFDTLTSNEKGAIVCVVQFGDSQTSTKYIGTGKRTVTTYPLGTILQLSRDRIANSGTETITLAYKPGQTRVNIYDAIALAAHRSGVDEGAVALLTAGESLTSAAAKLAAAINARAILRDWISATSSGNVVTITNLTTDGIKVEANSGNVEDWTREVGREKSKALVSVFSSNRDVRKLVGQKIVRELNTLSKNYGVEALDSNFFIGIQVCGGRLIQDNALMDLYRHDIMCDLSYVITRTDRAYAILVGICTTTIRN